MARILLDTTVLIDLLRGRPGAEAQLHRLRMADDEAYTCAVNVEEVARGLQPRERASAQLLLRGLRMVSLTEREGWQAGDWRRSYAVRGRTLSQSDALVAAAALTIGGRLATGNPKHFPMAELTVEHWPVGG